MYELVGDKIHEIFDAQVVDIGLYDLARTRRSFPYAIERGVRLDAETGPFDRRSARKSSMTRGAVPDQRRRRRGMREIGTSPVVAVGEPASRSLFVPLMVGDEVTRVTSRSRTSTATDAFSEADLRLLTTLAASLSVALENARLFDETQRLLTETNERAAELAIINSVQQGLAEQLDMQAMYDLVGDKLHEIFDAAGRSTSACTTARTNTIRLSVHDRARRAPRDVDRRHSDLDSAVIETHDAGRHR